MNRSFGTMGTAMLVLCLLAVGAEAQQQQQQPPRYREQTIQPQTGELTEMIGELRRLTDQAARTRAADPMFIGDLRRLANIYQERHDYATQWPVSVVSEDFRDGDFTRNPAWTPLEGTWEIVSRGNRMALHSAIMKPPAPVAAQTPATPASPPPPMTGQDVVVGVLGAILRQQSGQGGQSTQPAPAQPAPAQPALPSSAAIQLPLSISNAFALQIEMASGNADGRFEITLYRGQSAEAAYRLVYAPAADTGLVLGRLSQQGTKLLGSSTGRVSLEDEKTHIIDWRRDSAGKMTVALDGKPMIEAVDSEIRGSLNGLTLTNGGGSYWVTSLKVNGAREATTRPDGTPSYRRGTQ